MSICLVNCKAEIWLLIDSFIFGGIESHVLELSLGLKKAKQAVRVILLTQYQSEPALVKKLEQRAITHSYLDDIYQQLPQCHDNPRANSVIKLIAISKYYAPKAIHTHGYKASIIAKICKLRLKNKLKQISTFHAGETPSGKVQWYDRLDRYSAFISDSRLCVSQAIASKVPYHTELINNFIDLPNPIENTTVKKHIAFVGRLSYEKAPERFITLADNFPHHQFHLYGTGEMQPSLSALAGKNVLFHGFQPDMQAHWQHIELLVITSKAEGLPMAALEAMGRAIPVLSLNVGAMHTLIEQQKNGWLAANLSELTAHLHTWFGLSKQQQATIKINARKKIQDEFSSDTVIPKLIRLYS